MVYQISRLFGKPKILLSALAILPLLFVRPCGESGDLAGQPSDVDSRIGSGFSTGPWPPAFETHPKLLGPSYVLAL